MRFLLENPDAVRAAEAARDAGLDGVLLADLPAPLITAAALAGQVEDVLVAAEVTLGDRHPLELAEEAIVTDLALGGRLILVVRPAEGAEERFDEALDLLRLCLTPRPFRFEGRFWRVPANLPQNVWLPEEQVRVTPSPPRARLELWTSEHGSSGRDGGLSPSMIAGGMADGGTQFACREQWGEVALLIERLRAARPEWAVVAAPVDAARELGSIVRPRVQLHRLSPGLEAFWNAERPWEC